MVLVQKLVTFIRCAVEVFFLAPLLKDAFQWAMDGYLGPKLTQDVLNPVYFAIGARGYHIQSHILDIPPRFAMFSPGPPSLQVDEGYIFCLLGFISCH
jgi:hypothetical protein